MKRRSKRIRRKKKKRKKKKKKKRRRRRRTLLSSKTEPEMYEFVCRTADERRVWIQTLRDAIISCSQEGRTCYLYYYDASLA